MSDRITILRSDYDALLAAFNTLNGNVGEVEESVVAPEPAVPQMPSNGRPAIAWGAMVSQTFRERVWWISDTLTGVQGGLFDPNNLMACMAFESAETFSASIKNAAGSGAVGLIQFMPTTAAELGTTTAKLAAMTAEDQLNYVYKYFRNAIKTRGPILTLEDTYMAILLPSAVGKPNSTPLFTGGVAYRQNAGLDTNKDGVVTKFEAANLVRAKLDRGLKLAA